MPIPSSPTTYPGHLSDGELLVEVARAATEERRATAHLLALLIELDVRRLYLGEGFSSLFTYCTQALHLSEHAAYNRIEAARAARRFPIILQRISEGEITLTAVRLLAPHLTLENHGDVLARARHKNKRDVEFLVASLHPRESREGGRPEADCPRALQDSVHGRTRDVRETGARAGPLAACGAQRRSGNHLRPRAYAAGEEARTDEGRCS